MKRLWGPLVTIAALLVLNTVLQRALNPYFFQVLILVGINIILAVSLNLVNGFTGQFSIGHAGFMAAGAYGSAMFSLGIGQRMVDALVTAHVPAGAAQGFALLVALLLGGLLAALFGYLVGLPSLRLRGDYLAIVTLGFGEIIRVLILNIDVIGGARGLPGIPKWANF
ncbi:MAG: branched-chain amino acid ABC transporter permease, partial [Gemmatimonadales bacterium]